MPTIDDIKKFVAGSLHRFDLREGGSYSSPDEHYFHKRCGNEWVHVVYRQVEGRVVADVSFQKTSLVKWKEIGSGLEPSNIANTLQPYLE